MKPSPRRSEYPFLLNVFQGAFAGLALGLFWFVVAALSGEGGLGLRLKGCLTLMGICALTLGGVVAGSQLEGARGAIVGGLLGYFVPFMIYGVHVQLTTGWRNWLKPMNQDTPRPVSHSNPKSRNP